MSETVAARVRLCAGMALAVLAPLQGRAQETVELREIVVTANRAQQDLQRVGSAVTIIPASEIASWGTKSLGDVLRHVPGVDVAESGGPGGLTTLRIRGASSYQTLILIDNIRVGDASATAGETDLSNISPDDIERIEVLRGPQSALYGSDALGGVVNIITKKGARGQRTTLTVEGGSYGTLSTRLSTSGATETTSWAFSISGLHTDGFSRYGYRIGRITSTIPGGRLENDSADKLSGSARVTHRFGENVEIDIGFRRTQNWAQIDNPGAFASPRDNSFDKSRQILTTLYGKISTEAFGGRMRNALTLFTNTTDRVNRGLENCFDAFFNVYACDVIFRSRRYGAEYQGEADLGAAGKTIVGARTETEEASNRENWVLPVMASVPKFTGSQTTNSIFALHQLPIGPLSLSLGGRVDSVDGRNVFPTWRATVAYMIEQTGTKLRASAGTGAKAPSLYQRFSMYGTPNLRPEHNVGYDAGIDQNLFDNRLKLSVTAFDSRYRDLFGFDPFGNNFVGAYINIGRARISGVETSADAVIVPEAWRLRASYTRQRAMDLDRQQVLKLTPRDKGSLSVIYTGVHKLEVETRVTVAGRRIDTMNDFPFARVRLAPYAKIDARASYRVSDSVSVFARAENMTNARYQEIRDYGVAGRSYYAGMQVTW